MIEHPEIHSLAEIYGRMARNRLEALTRRPWEVSAQVDQLDLQIRFTAGEFSWLSPSISALDLGTLTQSGVVDRADKLADLIYSEWNRNSSGYDHERERLNQRPASGSATLEPGGSIRIEASGQRYVIALETDGETLSPGYLAAITDQLDRELRDGRSVLILALPERARFRILEME